MSQELIDLSKQKVDTTGWTRTDVIILVTTGGVGYLAMEAFRHFFPATPTMGEQVEALSRLIEAAGRAGAKKLKVRLSAAANASFMLPDSVKGKVIGQRDNTVDLELVFV
jgi:hypothetical protein